MKLPDVDGLELLATRGAAGTRDAGLIMTAFRRHAEALRAGAHGVIAKPFDLEDRCEWSGRSAPRPC